MTPQSDDAGTSTGLGGQAWQGLLAGAALGAAAMFMLDPDRGRRRRKQAGQAVRRLGKRGGDWIEAGGRDASNRWQGVLAQLRRLIGQAATPSDPQLQARVRARLGRLVSHPHAIHVDASAGCITLGGPILAHEKEALLAGVTRIVGVHEVRDQLEVHELANGIPALQGDGNVTKAASMTHSLPPAWRSLALAGGGVLAWYGLRRRSTAGVVLGTLGLAVLAGSAASPRARRVHHAGTGLPPEPPAAQHDKVLH